MAKIYTDMSDFERAWEEDFKNKVNMIKNIEEHSKEKTTCDGDWTEETLKDDIYGEVKDALINKDLAEKYKHRAIKDNRILIPDFMAEHIISRIDIISAYNASYKAHKTKENDNNGIYYFDECIRKIIDIVLKENLVD